MIDRAVITHLSSRKLAVRESQHHQADDPLLKINSKNVEIEKN